VGDTVTFRDWLNEQLAQEELNAEFAEDEKAAQRHDYVMRWERLMDAFDTFFPDAHIGLRYRIKPNGFNHYTVDGGIA